MLPGANRWGLAVAYQPNHLFGVKRGSVFI